MVKRYKKILQWFALALVVLFGLLLLIPYLFRGEIIRKFKEEINSNINAKVDFGKFSVSMIRTFPDLNFSVHDVSVTGIDTFSTDTLLYGDRIGARIDIWSLFEDQMVIHEIRMSDVRAKAKVLKDGRANWNIFKDSEEKDKADKSHFTFFIKQFIVDNAHVIYDDRDFDIYTTEENLKFKLKTISQKDHIYQTHTEMEDWTFGMDGMTYLSKAKLKLDAKIKTDPALWRLDFLDNTLWLNELVFGLKGFAAIPDDFEIDMSMDSERSGFKELLSLIPAIYRNDFEKLRAKGDIAVSAKVKGVYNDDSFPEISARLLVDEGEIAYEGMPDKISRISLDMKADQIQSSHDEMTIDISRFDAMFARHPVSMKLNVKNIDTDPLIDGFLKGKIDLGLLQSIFPIKGKSLAGLIHADVVLKGRISAIERKEYGKFEAKGFVNGSNIRYVEKPGKIDVRIPALKVDISPAYLNINDLKMLLGKSDFAVKGKVVNYLSYFFKNEPVRGQFDLTSGMIDVDELLSFGSEPQASSTTKTADSFSVNLPVNVDLTVNARVEKLKYDNILIQPASGTLRLADGKAYLDKFRLGMLKGVVELNGTYATKDLLKPEVNLKMNMIQIDIGETFRSFNTVQKLAPIAARSSGLFNMTLDFKAKLSDLASPDLSTLTGTCQFRTNSLEIEKSEVFKLIADMVKSEKFQNLALKDIKADIIMIDGRFKVLPFVVNNKKSKLLISGDQGLDGFIDYLINFDVASEELGPDVNKVANSIFSTVAGKYGIDLKAPERIQFDALVQGTLKKPVVKLDIKKQLGQVRENVVAQAKEKVQEVYTKARDEAVALAQKKADEILSVARANADKIMAEAQKAAQQIRDLGEKSALRLVEEGNKQADDLVAKAGSNPIAKLAAEEGAKRIRKESGAAADKVRSEANRNANEGLKLAQKQADDILAQAKREGDELIAKAKNTSLQM